MLCTLIGVIILSINIQVGLNMHLYNDIGDASASLRGSTSGIFFFFLLYLTTTLKIRHFCCLSIYCIMRYEELENMNN